MTQITLSSQDIVTETLSCVVYVAINHYNPMFKGNPQLKRVIADCIEVQFVKTQEAAVSLGTEFSNRVNTPEIVSKFYKALAPYRANADRQALKLYQSRGNELGINLINISEWAVRFMVVNFLQDHYERIVNRTFEIAQEEIDHIIECSDDFQKFMLKFTDQLEAGLRHTKYPE